MTASHDAGSAPAAPIERAIGLRHMYRLVSNFQPDWKPYLASGLTAAATSLCETGILILLTLSAASIATDAVQARTVGGLELDQSQMLALAAVLLVVRLVFMLLNAHVIARLATRCLLETRRQVLAAFVSAGWEHQSRHQQGILYDLLTNRAEVVGYSAIILSGVIVAAINLVILGTAALVLQPLAVLALVVVGALLSFVLRPLNRKTRRLSREYLGANEVFINSVTDLAQNARDLTAFGVGPRFMDRIMLQQVEATALYRRKSVLTQFTPQAYQTIGLGLAVGGLAVAAAVGGDDIATLGAVVLLLLRGISYGQALMTATQAVNERVPYVSSMVDLLEELDRVRRRPGTEVPDRPTDLVLSGVEYRYDEDLVLDGIDLTIRSGERIGVVGPSGSGKSTLLQVLAGLRTPTAGTYSVGGVPFGDLAPQWWAEEMALVSQDSKLLTGSVTTNISFLRDLSVEAVRDAAARAQLTTEVNALGGFHVELSSEGRSVSGGQLQRLSIARALAGDPAVLLLDEPTSALDVGTEARLQEVLTALQGKTTMVIVAHRLATVASCDRIIVLDAGRIEDDGAPGEVLARYGADAVAQWDLFVEDGTPTEGVGP
jgi:ATP-binding cassette, subfamily B, bacterial